ncbi:MAG: tetratricopeptide repeat protein [Bryobacteraceae bacterium]|nr:tetratricopeptide repeat protein [Bryobacteraceae bacterium]
MWRCALLCLLTALPGLAQTPDQVLLSHAVELHQKGDFGGAIAAYEKFLKAHPEAAAVRSNLGAALVHEGRLSDAIREYTTSLATDGSNAQVRLNLALAYYKAGEISKAAQELERVRAAFPAGSAELNRVLLLLADCAMRQGNDKRVIEILDPVVAADPGNLGALFLLGTALLNDKQEDRGAEMIDRIVRQGDRAESHMLVALTQMRLNVKKAAMDEVDRALALNPNLAEAHEVKGRILFTNSDLAGAERSFRKAIALDPNSFASLLFLGTLMRQQSRLDDARQFLERALRIRPNEVRARYQYAVLESDEDKDDSAVRILEALVRDLPGFTEAHRSLSTVYFRVGRPADGKREREIAEKLDAATQAKDQAQGRNLK